MDGESVMGRESPPRWCRAGLIVTVYVPPDHLRHGGLLRRPRRQLRPTASRGLLAVGPQSRMAGLRRWAHMLGFGGHFLTNSRYNSITFRLLRGERAVWQRTRTSGPQQDQPAGAPTVLVVNFLDFVSAGWHTTGDARLANTAGAKAREHRRTAREVLATAWAN